MYYLVTGGAGSGKSEYAERLAIKLWQDRNSCTSATLDDAGQKMEDHGDRKSCSELYYVATMFPYDDEETRQRIERHRKLREGKGFITIERPEDIGGIIDVIRHNKDAVVLLEDLTNLYANECFGQGPSHEIAEPLREIAGISAGLVVVSNELYCDGIEYPEETRSFLRELAALNIQIARDADHVVEVVAGLPQHIK